MISLSPDSALLYALRAVVVSAVLFGYYRLFLRNRPFHRFNRVFLCGTVLLSVLLPLVPMPGVGWAGMGEGPLLSGAWHRVVQGGWLEDEGAGPGVGSGVPSGVAASAARDWMAWLVWGYGLPALLLGAAFLRELGFIARMYRRYPREKRGDILFLFTRERGTPFSFLRMVFWHAELDMDSVEGRQMLRHELVHVRQRHTLDLLLLRPFLILFWFNPVFYLVYRELKTIHEFEADRLASDGGDRYAYAELLVRQTLESRHADLFHSFFSSPIKRRIIMITQFSSVRPGRWRRWMVAPLGCLLLCAFSNRIE